ncbi:UNVERIFIED_CONTAM: hypothetical protein H355_006725, partial [Colinus virginianus]
AASCPHPGKPQKKTVQVLPRPASGRHAEVPGAARGVGVGVPVEARLSSAALCPQVLRQLQPGALGTVLEAGLRAESDAEGGFVIKQVRAVARKTAALLMATAGEVGSSSRRSLKFCFHLNSNLNFVFCLVQVECADEKQANEALKEAMDLLKLHHSNICAYKELFVTWDNEVRID